MPAEYTEILYDFIGESSEVLDQMGIPLNREGADITSDMRCRGIDTFCSPTSE